MGTEWTLSLLREKFWVTRARYVINSVKRNCVVCRKLYGSPCGQKMADLPPERLISGNAPFTYVGIDVFGPFLVKLGRSEVKRYSCLFTCFNTRAVHLEKLDSLDTNAFLNAFRRFSITPGSIPNDMSPIRSNSPKLPSPKPNTRFLDQVSKTAGPIRSI